MRHGVVFLSMLLLGAGACGSSSSQNHGCAANQVWCAGCEPGTGACYTGGCPGVFCPPSDAGRCGARACTGSELCVHPSCGGAPPFCDPLPDGGTCPSGWTYRALCNSGQVQGPGCEPPPCTPPAAYCLTRPASCGATPTCACLPADVCNGGGSCGAVGGSDVVCVSG